MLYCYRSLQKSSVDKTFFLKMNERESCTVHNRGRLFNGVRRNNIVNTGQHEKTAFKSQKLRVFFHKFSLWECFCLGF